MEDGSENIDSIFKKDDFNNVYVSQWVAENIDCIDGNSSVSFCFMFFEK